jgi:hypothetical protein
MKRAACFLTCAWLAGALMLPARAATVQGAVVYEKIAATRRGLNLLFPAEAPAPLVRVELWSADGTTMLAEGATDDSGAYQFTIPDGSGRVLLVIRARSGIIQVADPDTGRIYGVSATFDPANWPQKVRIPDQGRLSGPFNILAALRRADRLLEQIEPGLPLGDRTLTVFWSPTWEGGTFRDGSLIYLNGRREEDSDEFDDSMILSLYGDYLLQRFSRTGSPGGPWSFGERLDPRLAFEGGWLYFFPQAVLGTPEFIDTWGDGGEEAFVLNLDEDRLEDDAPGYWSSYSVASTLWDLFAADGDEGPHLGLGLGPIWRVLREEFSRQAFPYLITMADGLVRQDGSRAAGIAQILARRRINYEFGKTPPVAEPFPRPIASGVPVTGRVHTLLSQRTNLLESADYYLLPLESARPVKVRLTVTGEPTPGAGRLTLLLFNEQGALMKEASSRLWGTGDEAELSLTLPPGRYVIGVLGYSSSGFGDAGYRLAAEF